MCRNNDQFEAWNACQIRNLNTSLFPPDNADLLLTRWITLLVFHGVTRVRGEYLVLFRLFDLVRELYNQRVTSKGSETDEFTQIRERDCPTDPVKPLHCSDALA